VATDNHIEAQASSTVTLHLTPYPRIAEMLVSIIQNCELNNDAKSSLHNVIKVAREANTSVKDGGAYAREQLKVSEIREAIQADLREMYHSLAGQIQGVNKGCEAILQSTDTMCKEVKEAKADTKVLVGEMSKVSVNTDKLASATGTPWCPSHCTLIVQWPTRESFAAWTRGSNRS
jgi:hypothetical protein